VSTNRPMPLQFPIAPVLSLVCLVVSAWADYQAGMDPITVETTQQPCTSGAAGEHYYRVAERDARIRGPKFKVFGTFEP